MTLETLILLETIGLLLVLVIAFIPWRKIGECIFANDPTKGLLYIEYGEDEDCVACEYLSSSNKGALYSYKWRGIRATVAVPADYHYRFLHGKRKIRLAHPGDAWASAWENSSNVPGECQKSAYNLDVVIRRHVASELVRTIYGHSKINWMVILVIIALAVGAYFMFGPGANKEAAPAPVVPAQQAPANPPTNVPHAMLELQYYV